MRGPWSKSHHGAASSGNTKCLKLQQESSGLHITTGVMALDQDVTRIPKENGEVSEGTPPTSRVAVAVIQSLTITHAPLMS